MTKRFDFRGDFDLMLYLIRMSDMRYQVTVDWDYCGKRQFRARLSDMIKYHKNMDFVKIQYRQSSKKGFHLKIDFDRPRQDLVARLLLGDDPSRLIHDSFRPLWRRGVLWDNKGTKQAGDWKTYDL